MNQRSPASTSPIDLLAIICAWYAVPAETFIAWVALYLAWRLIRNDAGRE